MPLRNQSLQTKLLLAFTLVNLISIAAFISYAQYAKSLDIRAQMDNRLRAAACSAMTIWSARAAPTA